jgi:hypothetical protein
VIGRLARRAPGLWPPSSRARDAAVRRSVVDVVLILGLAVYGGVVVALLVTGRLVPARAGALLVGPVAFAIGLLRPEWLVVGLLALPYQFLDSASPKYLTYLLIWALFGFLLQDGVRVGPQTGALPILGIIVLAAVHPAQVPLAAETFAHEIWLLLCYYAALMLLAFQATRTGRVTADQAANALLIGIVAGALVQPFINRLGPIEHGLLGTPWGGKFEYLSVMAFGVAYARSSLRRANSYPSIRWDRVLTWTFAPLILIGYGRAGWAAAFIIVALVSRWLHWKRVWIGAAIVVGLLLTVPVLRERVLPTEGTGLSGTAAITSISTGRWPLWVFLWDRAVLHLPGGNGFGYEWSLSSTEVFGTAGQFSRNQDFIFPHNDFLFLFVELGILGAGLLIVQWLHIAFTVHAAGRETSPEAVRYGTRILVPVLVVMFCVQLFDNGFTIRAVAEHFYLVAGLVFGLSAWSRRTAHTSPMLAHAA